VKIALPTVGENFQDQTSNIFNYSLNTAFNTFPTYFTFPDASDLFGSNLSSIKSHVQDSLPTYASTIAVNAHNSTTASLQLKLLQTQFDLVFNKNLPLAEILQIRYAPYFLAQIWALNPFSRGSVHISSSNTSSYPSINPNFFMLDWDLIQQAATARLLRRAILTAPLSTYVTTEYGPGYETIPANATDDVWGTWLKTTYSGNNHPVGTAAMMSKELGGVVNSRHLVYGTVNVRVVDASVIPFQVCGHTTSTLYALAERASDLIKEDNSDDDA
jgi:choline dehydrogenase-like flavoprotein